jgi:ubiquitin-conjugating enzyme E2 I
MSSIATQRLMAERKAWRKDRPFGFTAGPMKESDGGSGGGGGGGASGGAQTINFFKWKALIPGPKDTIWDQGFYPVTIEFSKDYPVKPPKCKFPEGFYHPNVYPSGTVCLSILNEEENWSPSITVKQILLGIQDLLKSPNPKSPAQSPAYVMYTQDRTEYNRLVKEQSKKYPAPI